jgi:hypothetical protein
VISIEECAFEGCGLTSIAIPENMKSIGEYAFSYCNHLNSITVVPRNTVYSDIDGVLFNKGKTVLIQYPEGKSQTNYVIPESVKRIRELAFDSCENLTSITIPESVQSIGECAFRCCGKLTALTIPKGMKRIGKSAFSYSDVLTSITISESVQSIGMCAFNGCRNLASITIPESVKTISKWAFEDCELLKDVIVRWDVPPKINRRVFKRALRDRVNLHIPAGTANAYRNDKIWGTFNIVETV